MVFPTGKPNLRDASCCKVDVVKGAAGDFLAGFFVKSAIEKSAFAQDFKKSSAAFLESKFDTVYFEKHVKIDGSDPKYDGSSAVDISKFDRSLVQMRSGRSAVESSDLEFKDILPSGTTDFVSNSEIKYVENNLARPSYDGDLELVSFSRLTRLSQTTRSKP